MVVLEMEEWLAQPSEGFNSKEEQLECQASEDGLTEESDFSMENYLVDAYEEYATLN